MCNKFGTLAVGTPAPFRRYIFSNNIDNPPYAVLERAKDFKVEYEVDFMINDIALFYKDSFSLEKGQWSPGCVENINHDSFLELVRTSGNLDSIILSGANYIRPHSLKQLKESVRSIVNIHFGDNSLFRGLDSNWWALLSNPESFPAVTLHLVDDGIDTGRVLKRIYSPRPFSQLTLGQLLHFEVVSANILMKGFLKGEISKSLSGGISPIGAYRSAMPSVKKAQAVKNLASTTL